MKVQDLLEAPMKLNSVQIKNKMGVYKKFKSFDAPGAAEWSQNWDETADKPKKKTASKPKITDDDISNMADDAMSSALDGVDPMDTLGDWMETNGIDMDDINRVVNKEQKLKGGLYAYIARSWAEMQNDRGEDSSDNPWGSTK